MICKSFENSVQNRNRYKNINIIHVIKILKKLYFCIMKDLEKEWNALILKLEKQFEDEMSLKGILYLIGVQELNFGVKRYDRDEKINVLHVAICKLLSNYGYYKFDSIDKDGWPHYKEIKAIESLSEVEQQNLIKKAIINYLN